MHPAGQQSAVRAPAHDEWSWHTRRESLRSKHPRPRPAAALPPQNAPTRCPLPPASQRTQTPCQRCAPCAHRPTQRPHPMLALLHAVKRTAVGPSQTLLAAAVERKQPMLCAAVQREHAGRRSPRALMDGPPSQPRVGTKGAAAACTHQPPLSHHHLRPADGLPPSHPLQHSRQDARSQRRRRALRGGGVAALGALLSRSCPDLQHRLHHQRHRRRPLR